LQNGAVREAIAEHAVDEVAGRLGETGDLAIAGALLATVEIGKVATETGGLASTGGGERGAVAGRGTECWSSGNIGKD
jgi:hypothetical protein